MIDRLPHTSQPRVSIIIPAHNEERYLGRTLQGLHHLDYPADRMEVLVIDNGSTDRTVEIAARGGARVVSKPGVTVGALRNLGASLASGEVLAFLDADCVPSEQWLAAAVRSLTTEACVTGARVAIPADATWVERAWFGETAAGRRLVPYINSGNLLVTRAVFDVVGGFDSTLVTGEDSEFCRRAGQLVPIVADDAIRVVHLGNPKTLRQFFRREAWHGLGALAPDGLTHRNRPLLGAAALIVITMTQVAGLVGWWLGSGPWVLLAATAALVAGLLTSALHRAGQSASATRVAQLGVLFYVYYAGRAWALLNLLRRHQPARWSR